MAAAETPAFLPEAVVYLGASVVLVPLFVRARLGAVLGYLTAGILIGPSVLGLVSAPERVLQFAEFGIVLLLFVIGLELQPSRLWAMRRDIFGLGLAQVLLCAAGLFALLRLSSSFTPEAALVLALPLSLSSTALVMQLLKERGLASTSLGERSFAVLLFQDLAIVPLLIIVGALSRVPNADAMPGWQTAAMSAGALAGLVLAGRYLLPSVFRVIGSLGAREAFVAAALLSVLGSAWLMASLGLSMALGAFVAGVMLAESPYRHALEADIEPYRGLLLGLFFIAVGMTLDLGILAARWPLALALVAGLMLVKTCIITLLARAFGKPWLPALQMGLLLSQGGEFGFVLFAEAERSLLIAPEAVQLFSAVVTVSMALTPLLFFAATRLGQRPSVQPLPAGPESSTHPADSEGRAIIVGMGRMGQVIAQMLRARGIDVTGIDTDARLIETAASFGNRVYFGDGRRIDILRAAGVEKAGLLVFAVDGRWDPETSLAPIRAAFPDLPILARAHDRLHWLTLRRAGVEVAVRETFESGVVLGRSALAMLGTPETAIDIIESEYRRLDLERLDLQLCTGDDHSGTDRLIRSRIELARPKA
jgi:monovalent cation:proton antiporter-2 (CPA2) family protein